LAYWIARIYGHTKLPLMNGGRKKWELEGRQLVTEATSVQPTRYVAAEPDLSLRARLKEVLAVVKRANGTTLVDVRSPAEFNGEIIAPPGLAETAQRKGHIPSPRTIPWAQAANDDGTFKSPDELRELYDDKGLAPSNWLTPGSAALATLIGDGVD
jgi:thiosulfate/3-mercaptopyruvate sulfurtransferase